MTARERLQRLGLLARPPGAGCPHSGGDTVCLVCPPDVHTKHDDDGTIDGTTNTVSGPPGRSMGVTNALEVQVDPALDLRAVLAAAQPVTVAARRAIDRMELHDLAGRLALLLDAENAVLEIRRTYGLPGDRFRAELAAAWSHDLPPQATGNALVCIVVTFTDYYGITYVVPVVVLPAHREHAIRMIYDLADENRWRIDNISTEASPRSGT